MADVLIVDDDHLVADATKAVVEAAGHRVRVGHSGQEGLLCLSAGPLPHCLVLDVDMPVLNGPRMAHEMLLRDAGEEKIPIVLVSGRADLPTIAGRMGTPYFLAKGIAGYGAALLGILERALRERLAPASA